MNEIVIPLLSWYQNNKRMLPWRMDQDPYHVWISEIMLQQTRIEAVKEYYHRFMKELPTIHSLANIEEDKLLKLWQGLGYYNRARNLKKAALLIENEYHGKFPDKYEDIKKLPGIGEYTAGAISSICFSEKVVAIDGNVLRVMMRLQNSKDNIDESQTKEKVKKILLEILPNNSGDFNEAMMELGEVICLPNAMPKCDICPLKIYCKANKNNTMFLLPIRNEKKAKKIENKMVYILIYGNEIAVEKRHEKGLLHNLWQFPNVLEQENETFLMDNKMEFKTHQSSIHYQHIFTHIIWNMQVNIVEVYNKRKIYTWKTIEQIENECAIPTAFMPVLEVAKKYIQLD